MAKYFLKRLGYAILTLWAVVTITFIVMKAIPGNPFANNEKLNAATLANLMAYYKLDLPIWQQYLNYLKSIVTFDFGPSMVSTTLNANYYITKGLPVSMQLGGQALIVAVFGGITLGTIAALNHNKWPDYISVAIGILGVSVPSFIMARILISVFAVNLGWLPVSGWKSQLHTILPTLAVAALPLANITRLARSSMLEIMGMEYIKTAKAKGLSRMAIIVRHGVRNAILPIVSTLGTTATTLLTGSFVVEKIFAVPGMGEALYKCVHNRDYSVIMAAAVVYSLVLITITLAIDLLYPLIDPRIRNLGGGVKVVVNEE